MLYDYFTLLMCCRSQWSKSSAGLDSYLHIMYCHAQSYVQLNIMNIKIFDVSKTSNMHKETVKTYIHV